MRQGRYYESHKFCYSFIPNHQSLSLAGQSFESLARETTVSCLLTNKNEVSCSTDAATSPLSNFNISKRYGVLSTSLRDYRTALAWNQLQQRERRWQRAHRRRPTVLETQEKTTETEAHSPSPTVHACKVSGGRVPVKI